MIMENSKCELKTNNQRIKNASRIYFFTRFVVTSEYIKTLAFLF